MKPRVYVETSVLSYLTALPNRDLIRAAHQQVTIEWWNRRERFELFISEAVLAEARRGDSTAASRRLAAADGLAILFASEEAQMLASSLLSSAAMPRNAAMRPKIEAVCLDAGVVPPVICTPEELEVQEDS